MDLSLSHCQPLAHSISSMATGLTSTVWEQLNTTTKGFRSQLHGHHAVTTISGDTEFMVVTGGIESYNPNISKFHVLLLNLTHADSFGEEEWIEMDEGDVPRDPGSSSDTGLCKPFQFNATADLWKREDLWEYSVQCPPSPRRGHLSSVINDYLYVFQGHSESDVEQDYHVYRISINDVLSNRWLGWRRILPRKTLDSSILSNAVIQGGLWHWDENELPRLVGFITRNTISKNNNIKQSNQVWTYDFTQDLWELLYEFAENEDDLLENAIVVDQHLLVVGRNRNFGLHLNWLNLNTRQITNDWESHKYIYPKQTLVTYEDVVTKSSVIVGFGPIMESNPSQLTISYLQYNEDDLLKLIPVQKSFLDPDNPFYRSGHTAVVSTRGNMYIFGGEDSTTVNTNAISRINVGGKDCSLKIHGYFYNINGSTGGELPVYYFDNDGTAEEEYDGEGGLLIFFFIVGQFFVCFVPNTRRHDQFSSSQGLSEEELNSFPRRILCEDDEAISDESVMCSICLAAFSAGDEVRDLPCEHIFHSSCVNDWLANESTCPLCRVSCRPRIDSTGPARFRRLSHWLRRDERELVTQNDSYSTDGVEMGTLT
mmetsp:Transcript_24318/g.36055  ORF Transcript_24318/g.36055 Transcript_24318/m.36055 type:complete len:597 (-) Transcript_24318:1573-3363(-)